MAIPVYVHGPATVKSRMRSLLVVEAEPISERQASLAAGFEFPQIDALPFNRAPQPLDKDIVHPSAFAIHGDGDTGILVGGLPDHHDPRYNTVKRILEKGLDVLPRPVFHEEVKEVYRGKSKYCRELRGILQ